MTSLYVAGVATETLLSPVPYLYVSGIAVETLLSIEEKVSLLALQPFAAGPLATNSPTTIAPAFGTTDEFCIGAENDTFSVPAATDFTVPGGRKC